MKMSCISNIICSVLAFCVSQIAMLPISKLCYLTDITTGPSRVITSGECGTKCGTKAGCLTFITCDLAYSKTCTIYKISSKETCGQEGVLCSYFVQVINWVFSYIIFVMHNLLKLQSKTVLFMLLTTYFSIAENSSFRFRRNLAISSVWKFDCITDNQDDDHNP